jgi:hypothetical protein
VVRALLFAVGTALLVVTAISIFRTMVIPRTTPSFVYVLVLRATDSVFNGAARALRGYSARDRLLAWSGPTGVMVALITWLVLFLAAYALMILGISDATFLDSLEQAGSALLTLGLLGDPSSATVVDFIAALTGPAVIALLIGFLPTLYQSYLTREARVLLSSEHSGSPAWGPEILARVHLLGVSDSLPSTFDNWINWCAQTRLSQTLYPALNRFRSPVSRRNWITSLLAHLDAAAISTAALTKTAEPRAANFLEQGTQALLALCATEVEIDDVVRLRGRNRRFRNMFAVFGVGTTVDSGKTERPGVSMGLSPETSAVARAITIDSLQGRTCDAHQVFVHDRHVGTSVTRAEFGEALDYLRRVGLEPVRTDDDAYDIFSRIRGRYEPAAYRLTERFTAPPAPWSGVRRPPLPTIWPALAGDELGQR